MPASIFNNDLWQFDDCFHSKFKIISEDQKLFFSNFLTSSQYPTFTIKYVKNAGRILMISFPKTNPYLFKILNNPSVLHFRLVFLLCLLCLRLNMQWIYLYLYTKTTSGWFPHSAQCDENDPNADCALAFSSRLGSLAGQNDSWQAPIPSPLSFDWAALHTGLYCQDPVRWQFVSPFYLFSYLHTLLCGS